MSKGKRIFVTYGNETYYKSLKRIYSEAESTGLFDKILCFTDKDLPDEIKNNPLFSYSRGGGYWLWKPWVVLQALSETDNPDDIIVYSDCGNSIYPNKKGWLKLFDLLKKHNAAFFYNGGKMVKWTRKSVFSHFPKLKKNQYQIISSFFLCNLEAEGLIRTWYDSMLNHPELVIDVPKERMNEEFGSFIEHRHDQAVLSAIAYSYKKIYKCAILPEKTERLRPKGQPVYNSRISDDQRRSTAIPSSTQSIFIVDKIIKPIRRLKTWYLCRF